LVDLSNVVSTVPDPAVATAGTSCAPVSEFFMLTVSDPVIDVIQAQPASVTPIAAGS
jgi:hypothetical protein